MLKVVAGVLAVVLLGTAALGYVLYRRYDGQIDRIPGLSRALPGVARPPAAPRDARNVLMVGSDSRANVGRSFGNDTGQRADVIMLAHLYGGSDDATLVSIPRDTYVPIPAYTDPQTGVQHPARSDRINSAMQTGGPALLIATIEQLTRIRVDNYVQIDFAGFQSMVDELGGVEVCLLAPAKERRSKIDLPAGRQTVDGEQALAFVRQRYGLRNGDLDRIKRQQAFLGSVARKVLSSDTLLNPGKLDGFLSAATKAVETDDRLTGAELTKLALRLRSFRSGGVRFTSVPVADTNGTRGRLRYLVLLDEPKAETLFETLRRDVKPGRSARSASPAPPSPAVVVPPSSVQVRVLNAAGLPGLGRRAAADLRTAGFVVVGAPGNSGRGETGTVIRYAPARLDAARTLAAAVPGATLTPDPAAGPVLELRVGSAYSGTAPARALATPSRSPSAAPSGSGSSAAPSTRTAEDDDCVY